MKKLLWLFVLLTFFGLTLWGQQNPEKKPTPADAEHERWMKENVYCSTCFSVAAPRNIERDVEKLESRLAALEKRVEAQSVIIGKLVEWQMHGVTPDTLLKSGTYWPNIVYVNVNGETTHRWASDVLQCTMTGYFACKVNYFGSATMSNAFRWVIYDCDKQTEAEKRSLTIWQPKNCKMAVLDWCLLHGEFRVLHSPTSKEKP